MSYEGYDEYITKKGKYLVVDAYDSLPMIDPDDSIEWWHPVDQTNGFDKRDPNTFSAEIRVIGQREVEKEDTYGNVWKAFEYQVAPDSDAWVKYE